jgi:hypothetical protein
VVSIRMMREERKDDGIAALFPGGTYIKLGLNVVVPTYPENVFE